MRVARGERGRGERNWRIGRGKITRGGGEDWHTSLLPRPNPFITFPFNLSGKGGSGSSGPMMGSRGSELGGGIVNDEDEVVELQGSRWRLI